ncbi:MAG: hypothetical protein M3N19_01730, partial [Candidatus Eremiobacteraeota bacterium]|nr:hypothetical protein [Candidatus Eremiobacteraeota bacterium]
AGALTEPSVVERPAARLLLRIPNAVLGIFYYLAVGAGVWWIGNALTSYLLIAAIAAGIMSCYLAYSLLFITKMPCLFCWTSHVINWLLIVQLTILYKFT